MSARLSQYVRVVLGDPDLELGATPRHLLEVLAHYADHTGVAWPPVSALARRMGITPANVRRARAELVAAGLIAVEIRRGHPADPGSRNRYRFPIASPLAISPDRAPARGPTTDHIARHRAADRAPARAHIARQRAIEDPLEEIQQGDVPTWVAQRWPRTVHG